MKNHKLQNRNICFYYNRYDVTQVTYLQTNDIVNDKFFDYRTDNRIEISQFSTRFKFRID